MRQLIDSVWESLYCVLENKNEIKTTMEARAVVVGGSRGGRLT